MTKDYWEAHIRVLCISFATAVTLITAFTATAAPPDLANAARAYRLKPSEAARAGLVRLATTPLGKFSLAAIDVNNDRYQTGADLKDIPAQLQDYAWFVRAEGLSGAMEPAAAAAEAERVLAAKNPPSPMANDAAILAAEQYVTLGNGARAVALLRDRPAALQSAESILIYAQALELAGDLPSAVKQYQRIYYEFPGGTPELTVKQHLEALRITLATTFPAPTDDAVLNRARVMADRGRGREAADELRLVRSTLSLPAQVASRVVEGYAQSSFDRRAALAFWQALKLPAGESDAERWFRVAQNAHRLNDDATAFAAMAHLDKEYARSPWRLEAGLYLADALLVRNDSARYVPFYTACYEANPKDPRAAYCHWKVAWTNYLNDRASSEKWLREHVADFPASDQASAALYFLGRIAEDRKDPASARALFDASIERGAQSYYADLSRARFASLGQAKPSPAVRQWLDKIAFPAVKHPDFTVDARTEQRIARARLLTEAGLDNWAELEFRFGAQTDSKSGPLALEWARLANERGQAYLGIRSIKALASGYVNWNLDEAPEEFWKYAYPVPYAEQLTGQAGARGVDWQVFAGLIRQESEFDPMARSRSNALGLAQLLPSTGRDVGRQLGIRGFESSMLHQPEINLQLGAKYLGALFSSLDNRWEMALASYNAGKGRVTEWMKWGDFREPAEFVETIPFKETRNYVKTVLRNSSVYRRLYAQPPLAAKAK